MSAPVLRTRFAPSPTGRLHLGHLVHMVYVWGLAQARGASIVARIEDHDRQRSNYKHEAGILGDVAWLGLMAHEGFKGTCPDAYRQSERKEKYAAALQQLIDNGLVYACNCSRKEIQARYEAKRGPVAAGQEVPYDNFCADMGLPLDDPDMGLRLRLPDTPVRFEDEVMGSQLQHPAQETGDLLLRDKLGNYTYHFCVVVDDLEHGIKLIIRGQDLLASTGRQLLLARALGHQAWQPVYYHHPLLLQPDGQKLAKSLNSQPIAAERKAGKSPEAVLGWAAHAIGLQPTPAPLKPEELGSLFR